MPKHAFWLRWIESSAAFDYLSKAAAFHINQRIDLPQKDTRLLRPQSFLRFLQFWRLLPVYRDFGPPGWKKEDYPEATAAQQYQPLSEADQRPAEFPKT
ncbi:hypothetical protein D3C80_1585030 [compost metagenome]